MKKLFVLFLLVALVPFTVGCGLFGDNDDTSPVDLTTLTVGVGGFSKPSIRAALSQDFTGYTIKIGDVTLQAYDEVVDNALAVPITYKIMFRALVAPSTISTLANTNPAIQVFAPGATVPVITVYAPLGGLTTKSEITLSKNDLTKVTVGGTTVDATTNSGNFVIITGATNGVNNTPVATTQAAAVAVDSLTPAFVVTFDKDVVLQNYTFDVGVKNVSKPEQELTMNDILVTAFGGDAKKANVAVHGKTLSAGQTYQISVRSIKADDKIVGSKTFFIKAPAQ